MKKKKVIVLKRVGNNGCNKQGIDSDSRVDSGNVTSVDDGVGITTNSEDKQARINVTSVRGDTKGDTQKEPTKEVVLNPYEELSPLFPVKEFQTHKAKVEWIVKRLQGIHSTAWGPSGHAIGLLLRELGQPIYAHVNGGGSVPSKKRKSKSTGRGRTGGRGSSTRVANASQASTVSNSKGTTSKGGDGHKGRGVETSSSRSTERTGSGSNKRVRNINPGKLVLKTKKVVVGGKK